MSDSDPHQFEIHDREVLAKAKAIIGGKESPRMWAQAVIEAVQKNEEWRGQRRINLLAPEAPTSPMEGLRYIGWQNEMLVGVRHELHLSQLRDSNKQVCRLALGALIRELHLPQLME